MVEILLFMAIFAVCSGVVISLLFTSTEQRVQQQAIAQVDQSGIQLLQTLTRRIRRAERVLYPTQGSSGSVLALRMAQNAEDPTILALQTGALLLGEYNTIRPLTSTGELLVTNFIVRNTSALDSRQSVEISFSITRAISLPKITVYERDFSALVTLFADDTLEGNSCGCDAPSCTANVYIWEYCTEQTCTASPVSFVCD